MTQRSGQWHLLGHDGDPVPADEWDVRDVAADMRTRAGDLSTVTDTLRRLSNLDGWRGEAAETFADKAGAVLDDLGKAEDRYSRVATALYDWAEDVSVARSASYGALQAAEEADRDVRRHTVQIAHGPQPTPAQIADQLDADQQRDAAQRRLDDARDQLRRAMGTLDAAADTARRRIDDAADVWDDGVWGDAQGWVRKHAELIEILCKALEVIGTILGAIILVCAIVLTAPVALLVAAFAVGLLLLAGHAALVAADTGKASWSDVAWDCFGLATLGFGGVLSKSAGRIVEGLLPAMATRLGSAARATAMERLIGGNVTRFGNALRITNPRNNLRVWTEGIIRGAESEADSVTASVRALEARSPTRLKVALTQDRELAKLHTLLAEMNRLGPSAEELRVLRAAQLRMWGGIAGGVGGNIPLAKDLPSLPGKIADLSDFAAEHAYDYLATPGRWLLAPVR